jgi:hypothetical protein
MTPKLYFSFSEFETLSADDKVSLMKTNGTSAIFLIIAHLELSNTGFEQLKVKLSFLTNNNSYSLESKQFFSLLLIWN